MPYFNIYKYGNIYKVVWFNGNLNDDNFKHDDEYLKDISEGIQAKKNGNIKYFADKFSENTAKTENVKKLENNIIRAKSAVTEYALCNEWEYFVTLTIDKRKQDRYDIDKYIHDLGVWIGNYNKKYGTKLEYLLIPEYHDDGAVHCHGFFRGVAAESLMINKNGYLDMSYYFNRFGYISLDKIHNKDACAFYMTKYIKKDMCSRADEIGKHLYYVSKGLKHKEIYISGNIEIEDKYKRAFYRNEFCNILWCDKVPDLIANKFKDRMDDIINVASDNNVHYVP